MATPALSGRFLYQSFYNGPTTVNAGEVVGEPILALPWTPVGTAELTTDTVAGRVLGTLGFRPGLSLELDGWIHSSENGLPAWVELTGKGHGARYQIKGWLLPDDHHVVGTVICQSGDLAKKPAGTSGPFILFPAK